MLNIMQHTSRDFTRVTIKQSSDPNHLNDVGKREMNDVGYALR